MTSPSSLARAIHLASRLSILALLLAGLGCSNAKPVTLSGKVTYKNKPVSSGSVSFHGANGQVAMGNLHEDGTFTATDVPLGEVQVTVQAGDPARYGQKMRGPAGAPAPARDAGPSMTLPTKYADARTSSLVYTITRQTSDLEIKLD